MALISAYRKDTGAKVRIPEHWLDHPKLGEPFERTPRQKARDAAKTAPTTKAPVAGDKKE